MESNNHLEHSTYTDHMSGIIPSMILTLPFVLALVIYLVMVADSKRLNRSWPHYRTVFWVAGVLSAIAAVFGPLADRAHMDFTVHMLSHLLLGMLAPLLMVVAAPWTLILRTLNVKYARLLSRLLKSKAICFISNPITAAILNVGGLWLLYTTNLYIMMQQNILLHIFIHLHVFLAGFLFTAAIIYFDPTPNRKSFCYRSLVLLAALAAHGILSKFIYAYPPNGVPAAQAEMGGMLMYYGGDAIDLVLIIIFCAQWYKTAQKKRQELSSYL